MPGSAQHDSQPTVFVLDFGAQYAQLIARRVREARVYSEIVPFDITAEEVQRRAPAATSPRLSPWAPTPS